MYTREERKFIQGKRGSMYKGMRKCIHEIRESTGKQKSPLRKEKLTDISNIKLYNMKVKWEKREKESY